LEDVREYGYVSWMRYLTTCPVRLVSGKKDPLYFVSRLTKNDQKGNTA
jgi:hypothetical protein